MYIELSELHAAAVVRHEDMTREYEAIGTGKTPLEEVEERKAGFLDDVKKFEQLIQNLNTHQGKIQAKLDSAERERELRAEEKSNALSERQRLTIARDNQELTPEDVTKMTEARKQLDVRLAAACGEREAVDNMAWKQEVQMTKKREVVEGLIKEFNTMAETLHIIPVGAKVRFV